MYLDKIVGLNKFSENSALKSGYSDFASGSGEEHEKLMKLSKKQVKRVFEEISDPEKKYTRNPNQVDVGRARNAVHRTISRLFIDALEREVSDTLFKVEDLCANIALDDSKLVLDVFDYPLIAKERSTNHKSKSFFHHLQTCFSEVFYFCKGKRNLIF